MVVRYDITDLQKRDCGAELCADLSLRALAQGCKLFQTVYFLPRQKKRRLIPLRRYKAFETAVASDFDVQTAVERELVLRLASLLWRLRHATTIDTGLLQTPNYRNEISEPENVKCPNETSGTHVVQFGNFANELRDQEEEESASQPELAASSVISKRFMRLDPGALERLRRYETALWRQVYQVIFVLDYLRQQNLDLKWLPRPSSSAGRLRPLRPLFPKGSGAT
ncbi:MAG TPA: hypothetical protein VEI98_06430 [Xanthobacteraceae bacterium]|nr:hypothetical protein [Xanthobacteraceae bacterium]